MAWFKNLKIGAKLYFTFAFILLLTVGLGVFSIAKIFQQNHVIQDLADNHLAVIRAAAQLDALVGSFRRGELLVTISQDDAAKAKYIKRMSEDLSKITDQQAIYEKLIDSDGERKTYDDFKKAWSVYVAENPKIIELAKQNNIALVDPVIRGVSSTNFNAAIASLKANQDGQLQLAQSQSKSIYKSNISACVWIGCAIVVCILFGGLFSVIASRNISTPIGKLVLQVSRVAEGDLTGRIDHDSDDETGQLSDAFNAMVANLKGVIGKVLETSCQVAASATQLRSEAQRVASDSEEVVGQAGTMATASEEMAATSADIARNCTLAAHNSQQANDAARSGASVIEATVAGMNRIADRVRESAQTVEGLGARSDQIGAIVGTIEDIADQTNLLALNAAIEAARAGEQGRGFAVVADEVRALAERTTKATREIGDMIKAIQQETRGAVLAMEEGVKEVARGTADAARSGQALQDILDTIGSVTVQVNQIAVAADQQTSTTDQISHNILQINDSVHDTARGAQETTSAAIRLTGVADELQTVVRKFRL